MSTAAEIILKFDAPSWKLHNLQDNYYCSHLTMLNAMHCYQSKRPIIIDEWASKQSATEKEARFVITYQPAFVEAFKRIGITPPKSAQSSRGWRRFMTYALKRGRSNHPHNAKWKPIMETYIAMRVTETLEPK